MYELVDVKVRRYRVASSGEGGKLARMFMLAALLNSSRPVLVMPQPKVSTVGKRIAIAWNQSAEAA